MTGSHFGKGTGRTQNYLLHHGGGRPPCLNAGDDQATIPLEKARQHFDVAVLIGLAIAFARQGSSGLGDRSGAVPSPVLAPLEAAARGGCGAAAMVADWLSRPSKAFHSEVDVIPERSTHMTPRFTLIGDGADYE